MSESPALPTLVNGEFPQRFTDEDSERLETELVRKHIRSHLPDAPDPVISRLDSLATDMERVMSVITQLESFLAQIMPAIDQIAANPAKFLMSLMGGGKNGR